MHWNVSVLMFVLMLIASGSARGTIESERRPTRPAPAQTVNSTREAKSRKAAVAPVSDLIGTWPVVLYVPGNELRFQLEFQKQGEHITGSLNTELGSLPVSGVLLKGRALSFQVTLFGNTYQFQGEISGNEISGQWFASGPWKASHAPGKKP